MLSENLDIMLGEDHFSTRDRDASLNSNSVRRPESTASHDFGNGHENTHVNSKVINPGKFTESDQNSAKANLRAYDTSCNKTRIYHQVYHFCN